MNYLRTATALVAVIAAARAGGWAADRLGQPRVLGELAAGLLLGNLSLMRFVGLEFLKTDPFVDGVSRIAVIVLMFHASLESTVGEMRKLLTKSKPELVDMVRRWPQDGEKPTFQSMHELFDDVSNFLEAAKTNLATADARLLCAMAAFVEDEEPHLIAAE